MVISVARCMHSSIRRLVSASANAQRMLTLLGWRVVRSHPDTGACPSSPSVSLRSPRYRPVLGSRRSLIRLRTVFDEAVVPTLPPTSFAAVPIQYPGGLPVAV